MCFLLFRVWLLFFRPSYTFSFLSTLVSDNFWVTLTLLYLFYFSPKHKNFIAEEYFSFCHFQIDSFRKVWQKFFSSLNFKNNRKGITIHFTSSHPEVSVSKRGRGERGMEEKYLPQITDFSKIEEVFSHTKLFPKSF